MIRQTRNPGSRIKTERGFSLIELLIVVSVILIIASIAIPNFIRSRMRANEATAVQNLRTIVTANTVYITTYGIGFASDISKLGGTSVIVNANNAGLIDSVLESKVKSGYTYDYVVTATDALGQALSYSVTADPITVGSTGERHFFTDQSGIVHFNTTGVASPTDPSI